MVPEATADQRRRDTRLAWMIVGASGAVTLLLVVLGAGWGLRQATRWAATQQRAPAVQPDLRQKAGTDDTVGSPDADSPQPVVVGPAPPDDATPIGRPAVWIVSDDYPAPALRNGDEGRVQVTVSVDQAGAPTGCAVRRSSGHWSLDNATCAVMLNKGRFDARPGGPRVRHWTSPVIRWALPHDAEVAKRGS